MDRRKFLVGLGSASVGGSALIGSGAFSRVESQRSVTIQVAEDPDAYLGMDKCRIDGSETPNSSYSSLDDDGHLRILMNDENPTIGDTDLGDGINSDSRMWVDNVFQLCNQGKEDVCVWIEDHDDWPEAPDAYDNERRVDFYLGGNRDRSIVGEDKAIGLPLGECVCVGLKTNSKDLSEDDELLDELDNEIRIVADVDGLCFFDEEEECPIYGITQGSGTQSIEGIAVPNFTDTFHVTDLDGYDEDQQYYPNGLAFDDVAGEWYFAHGDPAELSRTDGFTFEDLGTITTDRVAGAAWFANGHYYYMPQNSTELWRADSSGSPELVGDLANHGIDSVGLGDVAIDDGPVYISTSQSGGGARFIRVDVDYTSGSITNATVIADVNDSGVELDSHAVNKQIAFGPDGVLYAHQAGTNVTVGGEQINGNWYSVDDLSTGEITLEAELDQEYTDLAQCAFPPAFTTR